MIKKRIGLKALGTNGTQNIVSTKTDLVTSNGELFIVFNMVTNGSF